METDLNELSEKIIGCVFTIHSKLGNGFLEKIYENALLIELKKAGLKTTSQKTIQVFYDDILVGDFVPDLIVEDRVIVELKCVNSLSSTHSAQCINYLKATKLQFCLLVNFGEERAKIKRLINPELGLRL